MFKTTDAKKIPIKNLYYMLIYSWKKLEESEVVDIGGKDSTELLDLFARVLVGGINHLVRRGFDRGYVSFSSQMSCIKGKIDFNESKKKLLFHKGKLICRFDNLDYNILHNQILKTTITRLIQYKKLNPELHRKLIDISRMLVGVETVPLSKRIFGMVQLHSNNYFYDFLLKICELVYECFIPDKNLGGFKFRDFLEDKNKMNQIFEKFVYNFYNLEQDKFKVRSENISWDFTPLDDESGNYLPMMQTDVSLESKTRKIIIDTKFYRSTFQKHYDKSTIHSGNLYQLFSYLKNVEAKGGELNKKSEGILLYPTVDEECDLGYEFDGHKLYQKNREPESGLEEDKGEVVKYCIFSIKPSM